jgi:hypothetical protein
MYWSNNAWQDYNPSTVEYQYEYDRFGRPLRYRSGYRGLTGQNDRDRMGAENRTDVGRSDTNRRDADNIHRDSEVKGTDRDNRNDKDANRTDRDNRNDKDPSRSDRDRETSKPGEARSDNNAKPSDKSEENKPGK